MKRGYRMEYRVKVGAYWLTKFDDLRDTETFVNADEDESNAFTFSGNLSTLQDSVTKYNKKTGSDLYVVNEAGNRITPENKNDGRTYYWYVNGLWVSKVNDGSVETVPLIKDALAFDSFEDVEKAKMAAAEWGYSVKDSITFHEENKHNKNSHILIPSRRKEYKDGDDEYDGFYIKTGDDLFFRGLGLFMPNLENVLSTNDKRYAIRFSTLEKATKYIQDAKEAGYNIESWSIVGHKNSEIDKFDNIPDFDLIAIDKALVELRRYSDDLKAIQKENVDLEKTEKKDGNHYVSFLTSNGYNVNYETAHKIGETIANDLIKKVEAAKRHLVELTSLRLK